MAKIFKFPHKNIHVAITLSHKARVLQDSNSEAAVGLFQQAVRYFISDALSSRAQIKSLLQENEMLSEWKRLIELGIDGICTKQPEKLIKFVKQGDLN